VDRIKEKALKSFVIYTGDSTPWHGFEQKNSTFSKGDSCGFSGSSVLLLQNFFFVLEQMNVPLWIGNSDAFLVEAFLDGFG
jgi:hypothetical protein